MRYGNKHIRLAFVMSFVLMLSTFVYGKASTILNEANVSSELELDYKILPGEDALSLGEQVLAAHPEIDSSAHVVIPSAEEVAQAKKMRAGNRFIDFFPDPVLAGTIAASFNKTINDTTTTSQLADYLGVNYGGTWGNTLVINNTNMADVSGIEYLTNIHSFFFGKNKINKLPDAISNKTNLRGFDLSYNQLEVLPADFGKVTQSTRLRAMDFMHNKLKSFPASFGQYTIDPYFYNLDLKYNEIEELPDSFCKLALSGFSIEHNKLKKLPDTFGASGYDRQYSYLYLNDNQLTELPNTFQYFTGLRQLMLGNNKLSVLPQNFGGIRFVAYGYNHSINGQINVLDLSHNQLTKLPDNFGNIVKSGTSSLKELHLNNNLLEELPDSMSNMVFYGISGTGSVVSHNMLNLSNNKLKKLPDNFGNIIVSNAPTNGATINLSNNQLEDLPAGFASGNLGQSGHVRELFLNNNKFKTFPDNLGTFKFRNTNSAMMDISGNQLEALPTGMVTFLNNQKANGRAKIAEQVAMLADMTVTEETNPTGANFLPEIVRTINGFGTVGGEVMTGTVSATKDGVTKTVSLAEILSANFEYEDLFPEGGMYDMQVKTTNPASNKYYFAHDFTYKLSWTPFKIDVNVTYDKTDWTNQDVVATIEIESNLPLVAAKIAGVNMTIQAGDLRATGTHTFTSSGSVAITATRNGGRTITNEAKVSWIDKDAPTVTGMSSVASDEIHALKSSDLSNVSFVDPATINADHNGQNKSGLIDTTRELWLYQVVNGVTSTTVTQKIGWDSIATSWSTITPGRYYYDIVAKDNAGNIGKASDPYAGNLIGVDGTGTTGVKSITINASKPVITLTPTGTMGSNEWYVSSVDMAVESSNASGIAFRDITVKDDITTNVLYNKAPNASTDSGNFNLDDGIYDLHGVALDIIDLKGETPIHTIKIDKTNPVITANANGIGLLKDISFTISDPTPVGVPTASASGFDANSLELVVSKYRNGDIVRTYTGSEDQIKAAIVADMSLDSGVYTIAVKAKDMAGNSSNVDDANAYQFIHEKVGDSDIVLIEEVYAPDGRNNAALPLDQRVYSTSTVDLSYKIISKIPLASVDYNGVLETASTVNEPDADDKYIYTANKTVSANDHVPVVITTKGTTVLSPMLDIYWIDKAAPTITWSAGINEINEFVDLGGTVAIQFADTPEISASGKTVMSEINPTKTRYTIKSSAGATTGEQLTLQNAYNEAIAQDYRGKVELIVFAEDYAGNQTTVSSASLFANPEYYVLDSSKTGPPGETDSGPGALDNTIPAPNLLISGGESQLSNLQVGSRFIINYTEKDLLKAYSRTKFYVSGDLTNKLSSAFTVQQSGTRIIVTANQPGNYDMYVVGVDNSFRKFVLTVK